MLCFLFFFSHFTFCEWHVLTCTHFCVLCQQTHSNSLILIGVITHILCVFAILFCVSVAVIQYASHAHQLLWIEDFEDKIKEIETEYFLPYLDDRSGGRLEIARVGNPSKSHFYFSPFLVRFVRKERWRISIFILSIQMRWWENILTIFSLCSLVCETTYLSFHFSHK